MIPGAVQCWKDTHGVVQNNTSPIGGPINTGSAMGDENSDQLFGVIPIPISGGTAKKYHATGWKRIDPDATGTLKNPYLCLRTGMQSNASAGQITIQSTSDLDDGDVKHMAKADADQTGWDAMTATCTGTTPATTAETADVDTVMRAEYIKDGAEARPIGTITGSIDGQILYTIAGTGLPAVDDAGQGNIMATREVRLAVATDIDTEIGWSGTCNRLTAPDVNVGSFEYATRWEDADESLPVASDMVPGSTINFVAEFNALPGAYRPVAGYLSVDVDLGGDDED